MIKQELIEDVVSQNLMLNTTINRGELARHLNEPAFYAEIYRQMAHKIASHLFEKIGPAIDEALKKDQQVTE